MKNCDCYDFSSLPLALILPLIDPYNTSSHTTSDEIAALESQNTINNLRRRILELETALRISTDSVSDMKAWFEVKVRFLTISMAMSLPLTACPSTRMALSET